MKAYTTTDIRKMEEADNPMFELMWKPTSQISPTPLFEGFSGNFAETVVFTFRDKKCFMRKYVVPRDPKTASQLRKRDHMRRVSALWLAIGADARGQWHAWAKRYRRNPAAKTFPNGRNVFAGAVLSTGMMGLPAPTAAPPGAPPLPVISITQEPVAGDDCFVFRIHHAIRNVSGKRLLLEMTDEMPTLRRHPHDPDFRLWSAVDAASFVALKGDGELYVLEGARFAVRPGCRYGVRITVVTEQGIRSGSMTRDFIKPGVQPTNAASARVDDAPFVSSVPTGRIARRTKPRGPKRYDAVSLYRQFNKVSQELRYPNGPPQPLRAGRRRR